MSARRVVEDNIRLRALLRFKGVDDETINTWTPEERKREQKPLPREDCDILQVDKPVRFLASSSCHWRLKLNPAQDHLNPPISNDTLILAQPAVPEINTKFGECHNQTNLSKGCQRSDQSRRACSKKASPEGLSAPAQSAPCKLISRVAEDPSTDITQILVGAYETNKPTPMDGVECSEAYRMLMQFGTTEEKLDKISQALEEGCTANDGAHGGCRVRNEIIWKAIDDLS